MKKTFSYIILLIIIIIPLNVKAVSSECENKLKNSFISCKYSHITDNCSLSFSVIIDNGKFTYADEQKRELPSGGLGCNYNYQNFSKDDLVTDDCTLKCPKVDMRHPSDGERETITIKPDANGNFRADSEDIRYDYEEVASYTATIDSNYDYGEFYQVNKNNFSCNNINTDYIGKKNISGKTVYIVASNCEITKDFYCIDPEMKVYQLSDIKSSDGKAVKGWVCRKSKDKDSDRHKYDNTLGNIQFNPEDPRLNYGSLCSNDGVRQAVKIIGYVVKICKWVAPLIIIILGMVDFAKAVISNDEKALSKATSSLIKRIVAGIVVIFIPTLIIAILNAIKVTNGIENTDFGACTTCLFDPGACK